MHRKQIKFIKNLSPDARNKLSVRHPHIVRTISTREEYKKAGIKNHEIKINNYKVFIGKSFLGCGTVTFPDISGCLN